MSVAQSLSKSTTKVPSLEEQIALLKAENAKLHEDLEKRKTQGVSIKVSEKGAVSVYGLGRFPVTLYRGQMERLLAMADSIREFIQANESKLATKE